MELINQHVLFAQPADWKQPPTWSRVWQNQVASAVTGAESRLGVRAQPRVGLEFTITPRNLAEQIELNECVLAAKKSGLACAPYHGRGCALTATAAADATAKTLRANFAWAAGDWALFCDANGHAEAHEITAVGTPGTGLTTLQPAEALTRAYSAGLLVWPLLFGRFECDELPARSGVNGPARIKITERIAARTAQVGVDPVVSGSGIGYWKIGDTFIVQ